MNDPDTLASQRVQAYRMGRKRRGDIRIFLLWSLCDHPMHGYELIKFLTEKTYGLWTPSAGSVYPTLELLESQGLVTSKAEDGKKIYSITPAGRETADAMSDGPFANDPAQRDAIRDLREANMLIRRIMRAIVTRGSVADLQAAAKIMNTAKGQLITVFDRLPSKN